MTRLRSLIFAVEGEGVFPTDMLRYDRCYPLTESDSYTMESHNGMLEPHRRVLLCCDDARPRTPTEGRWESFGWKVTPLTSEEAMRYD